MLSAHSIMTLIGEKKLEWPGRLRGDGLLLTLGTPLQPLAAPGSSIVDLAQQSSIDDLYPEPIDEWTTYDLRQGHMVLGAVAEPLRVGAGLLGMIGGLSHLARVGLSVHVTSPFVLPGWSGRLTLELVNSGPAVLRLHRGMPLARLLICKMDDAHARAVTAHPFYGHESDLRSRYAEEFVIGQTRR
ncbi:dCTP deaminase [Nonomuraea wenchangensis]